MKTIKSTPDRCEQARCRHKLSARFLLRSRRALSQRRGSLPKVAWLDAARHAPIGSLFVAVLVSALGCSVPKAPPVFPEHSPPSTHLPPSDVPGHGRVLLDVVGQPARVEVIESRDYPWGTPGAIASEFSGGLETTRGERVRPACEHTPCVLDMPFGTFEFRFSQGARRDTAFVTF